MPDGRPPELPATAPVELVEFVACKRDSVTITGGDLTWLPLDMGVTPTLGLEPGASPGTGTITIGLGFVSLTLPVSLVGGELQVDTNGVSAIPGAKEAIDTWVQDLNDWFRRNGKRFKQTSIKGGSVTLEKEPIPVAPPPGGGGTVGGGGGTAPGPVPPAGGTPPATTPAPAPGNSGCWLLGLIALVIVGVIGVAVVTGIVVVPGGGGGAVASTSPAASGAAVPSSPPASSAPPPAPSSAPPASVPSSAPPVSAPSSAPPAAPPPNGAGPALGFLEDYAGLTADDIALLEWLNDSADDWYFPQPGQTPKEHPAEVDLRSATGFIRTLTSETAAAVSAGAPCSVDSALADGTEYRTACNQDKPLTAGDYVVIITTHAGGFPSDYPAAGLHSWSVFTNRDNDLATGYASSLPDNFLIGADTYFEMLAFTSEGQAKNYILATNTSDPVRTDTGQKQGNLATTARVVWFFNEGTQTWFIPKDDFGPNWYPGAFATTNRGANSPNTLAADALSGPSLADWLKAFPLAPLSR